MVYKGYKILANSNRTAFFETNADGDALNEVKGIQYMTLDDELWYSIVDKDNWVHQSFETVDEAKEGIDWALKEGVLDEVTA